MLNISKLELALKDSKISKARLCSQLNIARTTFDAILNGGDTKISTIEAIARALGVNIGYLFDETPVNERYEARDGGFAAKDMEIDTVDQRKYTVTRDETVIDEEAIVLPPDCPADARYAVERLRNENALLSEMVTQYKERIDELKERIVELKGNR